jgi:hypothetical protein
MRRIVTVRSGVTFDVDHLLITWFDYDRIVSIPARAVVCDRCDGRGVHDNENLRGFTREDFEEDPDLASDYRAGAYDVRCSACGGTRVVLVPKDGRTPDARRYAQYLAAAERADAEDAAERRHFDRGV